MVFIQIAFIIMVPVLALLVLAFTRIYTQKHCPGTRRHGSEREQVNRQFQKTLADYLQSPHCGGLLREETDRAKEERGKQDSG